MHDCGGGGCGECMMLVLMSVQGADVSGDDFN